MPATKREEEKEMLAHEKKEENMLTQLIMCDPIAVVVIILI